jgi:hypothetical protein
MDGYSIREPSGGDRAELRPVASPQFLSRRHRPEPHMSVPPSDGNRRLEGERLRQYQVDSTGFHESTNR